MKSADWSKLLHLKCSLTQVGADPASPGGYAARLGQLEQGARMFGEQQPPGSSTTRYVT